jgi:hypothetical protein
MTAFTPTTDLSRRAAEELGAILGQFAAGEAEVVRAYFEQPHTPQEHLDVLLRQMGREIQSANRLPQAIEMFASLENGVDRHAFVEYLEHIAEETNHYAILADLAEWVIGRGITAQEARRYEIFARYEPGADSAKAVNPLLPEAGRMLEVSRALVQELGFERGNPIARLTEGGGAGAYIECMRLHGDEFRERLAEAMRRILEDEIHHGPERLQGFAENWVRDLEDLETAKRWLRAYMAQHLRVRNEIWNHPLSVDRMAAIDRGETAPFDPHIEI